MGFTGWVGATLLLTATVFLLISCLTAPIIKPLGFLSITGVFKDGSEEQRVIFGAFGACFTATKDTAWTCTKAKMGYNISEVIDYFNTPDSKVDTALTIVTKALVLHPIAVVFAFIGFVISAFSNKFGFLFATLSATLAFIVALIALIVDFVIFRVAMQRISKTIRGKDQDAFKITMTWGPAMWITLIGVACLLVAQFFTFFQCCCGRTRSQKDRDEMHKEASKYPAHAPYGP